METRGKAPRLDRHSRHSSPGLGGAVSHKTATLTLEESSSDLGFAHLEDVRYLHTGGCLVEGLLYLPASTHITAARIQNRVYSLELDTRPCGGHAQNLCEANTDGDQSAASCQHTNLEVPCVFGAVSSWARIAYQTQASQTA